MNRKKIKSKPRTKPRVVHTLRLDSNIIALAKSLATKLKKSEAEVFEMGVEALGPALNTTK